MQIELRTSTQFSSPESYSVHVNERHIGYIVMTYSGAFVGYDTDYNPVPLTYKYGKDVAARTLAERIK